MASKLYKETCLFRIATNMNTKVSQNFTPLKRTLTVTHLLKTEDRIVNMKNKKANHSEVQKIVRIGEPHGKARLGKFNTQVLRRNKSQ